jgi:hypothetical protein
MRGVPLTQVLGAIFFASSLVSMARCLLLEAPQRDMAIYVENLQKRRGIFALSLLLVEGVGWILYAVGLFLVWRQVVDILTISASENVTNLICWIKDTIVLVVGFCWILQVVVRVLVGHRSKFDSHLLLVKYGLVCNIILVDSSIRGQPENGMRGKNFYAALLTMEVFIGSLSLTYLLSALTRSLLSWNSSVRVAGSDGGAAEAAESRIAKTDERGSDGLPVSQEAHAPKLAVFSQNHAPLGDSSSSMNTANIQGTAQGHSATGSASSASNADEVDTRRPPTRLTKVRFGIVIDTLINLLCKPLWSVIVQLSQLDLTGRTKSSGSMVNRTQEAAKKNDARLADAEQGAALPEALMQQTNRSRASWALRALIRCALILISCPFVLAGMLVVCFMEDIVLGADWADREHLEDPASQAVALGVTNFVTAAVYYLLAFDGAGTSVRSWTEILG